MAGERPRRTSDQRPQGRPVDDEPAEIQRFSVRRASVAGPEAQVGPQAGQQLAGIE